jgi:hypothetical protein
MGGNLLKKWNLPDKRVGNVDYLRLKQEIVARLDHDRVKGQTISPYDRIVYCDKIGVADAVRDKMEHGDLDIIFGLDDDRTAQSVVFVHNGDIYTGAAKYITAAFGYAPHVNSNVYSFPVDGFQVDITFVPSDQYNSTIAYTSWGDLGNLMGRVYHKLGLHYGHDGLQFWIRQGMFDSNVAWSDSDHIYSKSVVTRNTNTIFTIGGFDYKRWLKGFNNEIEVFEFVTQSKFFHPDLFALENLNHINRTRNRKRGMYMRFVEWLAVKYPDPIPPIIYPSKEEVAIVMQHRFPDVRNDVDKYRFQHATDKIVKAKINGKLVQEWIDSDSGPLIGSIMKQFMASHSKHEIIEMSQQEIVDKVVNLRYEICHG